MSLNGYSTDRNVDLPLSVRSFLDWVAHFRKKKNKDSVEETTCSAAVVKAARTGVTHFYTEICPDTSACVEKGSSFLSEDGKVRCFGNPALSPMVIKYMSGLEKFKSTTHTTKHADAFTAMMRSECRRFLAYDAEKKAGRKISAAVQALFNGFSNFA